MEPAQPHIPCPSCGSLEFELLQAVVDHFLSKEVFDIRSCKSCGLLRTYPYPDDLDPYYESDEYLSHGAQKAGLFARAYRAAKRVNLRWKLQVIQSFHREGHIMDYGCGTGDFLDTCAVVGYQVSGAEPSAEARSHIAPHIQDRVSHPDHLLFKDGRYDAITLWHVLEHIPDPHSVLDRLVGHLQPNGHLFIAVPNVESFDATYFGSDWAAWDVPRHLWHFRSNDIDSMAQRLNLEVVKIKPMLLDVFYVALLSARYQGSSKLMALVFSSWATLRVIFGGRKGCSSLLYVLKRK